MTTDPQLPGSPDSDSPENDEPQVFAVSRQGQETNFTRRGFLALAGVATTGLAIATTGNNAAAQGNPCSLRTTYEGLRVRSGPGANFAAVGALQANTDYPILAKGKDKGGATWWQVNVAGVGPAWVISTYVTTSGDCSVVPLAGAPGPAQPTAAPASVACTLRTQTDGLRLRSGPGADYLLVGQMRAATDYPILAKGRDPKGAIWWQIDAAGIGHVWVIGTYVFTHGDCGAVPLVEAPPKVQPKQGDTAPGQTGVNVNINGQSFTLPCGSPIPAGAVCTCNCVTVPAPCSCVGHTFCTCDTVCTCQGVGHYWHPN